MKDEVDLARQKRLERERTAEERRQEAEDLRVWKPFRLASTLEGCGSQTLAQTYSDFIDLLRSDEPLGADLREAIANALERGQINGSGVRLRIEADGQFFKAMASMESDDKLIDAGLYIARERKKKRSISSIARDLPAMFNIDDGVDYARRARKLYDHFQRWIEANIDDLFDINGDLAHHGYEDYDNEDDGFEMAKSEYLLKRVPAPLLPPAK